MDYQIQTQFQGPGFVAVPNYVAQASALSPEALGVLVYLASLPRGFVARVSVIQERFALGKDKWQRIAREMREAGAMVTEAIRGSGGRVIGKRVIVRWPDETQPDQAQGTESRETRPSDRKPGKPTVGKPAKHCRETRQTLPGNPAPYKEKEETQARAQKPAPVARRKGGGSGAASGLVLPPAVMYAYLNEAKPGETREAFAARYDAITANAAQAAGGA